MTITPDLAPPAVAPVVAPLANAALVGKRANTAADPQAQALNDRLTLLAQHGHTWMPPDTAVAVASAPNVSDQSMLDVAGSLKQQVAQAWNGFSENFNDNILHAQPTAALTLARYLHASLGPLPIRQDDLHVIQRNLQKQGFGQGLTVNGVWDSGWNGAYNQWQNDLKTRQLAGDRPGSVSTSHAGHSIWDALLPTHAINAIVGYAKGLAHATNTLLGDVSGAVVNIPNIVSGHTDNSAASNETRAWFQNIGGGTLTAQDIAQQNETHRLTQDVGTVLALTPIAGEGSAAARVVQGAWEGGVSRQFAERTTGTIAKSFFGGRTRQMLADDAARRGILNTRVLQNIPLMRQVGPAVGRLADADGLYYKTRTLLASPYALPQVRVAGAIGQRYMLAGAGLNLAAQGLQAVGQGNQITQSILGDHTFDTVAQNLNRITHSGAGTRFDEAVNALGFILHGPLGSTAASTAVGDKVQALTDGMSEFLGKYNAEGAWQNAVAKATGQKTSVTDLHKAFGSPDLFERYMANKVADLAASHYAQDTAQRSGLTFGSDAYRTKVGELADQVWNNPHLHEKAILELLADPIELENRIAVDMIHNRLHPSEYTPDLVDPGAGTGDIKNYAANGVAWMTAGSHLQDVIRSGLASHMFGADGKTVIANAQDRFDHGYDMPNPQRTMDVTRRDYTSQVGSLLTSVQQRVNDARTQLGRQVTDAETALAANPKDKALIGTLQAARNRQKLIESSLDENNLRSFADLMSKTGRRRQWDRLVKDTARLRQLVDQASATPEERLALSHLIDNVGDPKQFADELYTNVNGEPRPFTEPVGSGDWLRQVLQHSTGALGVARLDTKTAQEAALDVSNFERRLNAAKDPASVEKVTEDMKNYGFREFGLTEHQLGVFDPAKLLQVLDERAQRLASDVYLTYDAPQELRDRLAAMKELGYKPVLGSHIGHLWDSSLPSMPELRGAIGWRRKIAGTIGVTPEQVSSRAAGQDAKIRVLREINNAVADRPLPPRTNAETIAEVLRDKGLLHTEPKLLERAATALSYPMHRKGIQQLASDRGIDFQAAKAEYEQNMAQALQLRDLPRKEFIRVLTTPGEFENGAQWAGVDKQTANLIRRAVLRGYSDRPGYIQGLSTLEDWARGGFSILDKAAVKYSGPGFPSELVQRTAELPNNLVILRNRLRFTLSPFFDFRRVAKQNAKMSIDGVTPTLNPLNHMINNGTFTKAHKLLTHLVGDPQIEGFDDADRYLHQQSVWGLYNSRHYEAYYAWEKKAAGWSDEEIRQGIRRVFEYGSTRASGRSALERTVNTVFFPFSFEKTLLRNVGAYMIDHPQQALLMTGAMTAYDEANKNSVINQWVHDHLPILRDMQKLNAFAHGISPGELGGINAPLLNLFLPQTWGKGMTKKNLQRFLPVWKDFGQLIHDTREQTVIARNAALNTLDYATSLGAKRSLFDPYRPTITPEAQIADASRTRSEFITALAPVLQRNASAGPADKIVWPAFPGLPQRIVGQPVDHTTIGYLVKVWYPAYNPTSGTTYAIQQQEALAKEIAKVAEKNPGRAAEYRAFQQVADTVQSHLNRGDYDTQQAADLMMTLRHIAGTLSSTDPEFYRIFTKHFAFSLGPQTEVPA